MFNINETTRCAVFINDREFVLDQGNTLQVLHISASSLFKLPMLHIEFLDLLNLMPTYELKDNVPLRIVINGLYQYNRKFRVTRWRPKAVGTGYQYSIDGVWDAPKYWAGSDNQGITGTSASALKQIADICGLETYSRNAQTSDSMTWMQGNRPYSDFARKIARHGYVSDTSHMMLAVDSLGYLRYLDTNDLKAPVVEVSYTPPEGSGQLMITDFSPVAKSGMNNVIGGYAYHAHSQQADAASEITPIEDKVVYKSDSKYPLLDTDVRSKIDRGPVSYSPINFGNVHNNFERARYQNLRFNLLKSLSGQFLFPFQTPLEPGNQMVYSQTPGMKSTSYNGQYTITEKIIFVQGKVYNEKLVGVRNGLSE